MSDRGLAKVVETSQPTISRTRGKMMKNGLITYFAVPDLPEIGYKILAFTEIHGLIEYMGDFIENLKGINNVVYAAVTPGKLFIISAHWDIADYTQFKAECMNSGGIVESRFLVTSLTKTVKPLQFSSLVNNLDRWKQRALKERA